MKIKKSIYIGLLTFLVSIYISSVVNGGMFDFLKKGMTKSWNIHKENISFCNGSLIVVEDGYKLLKIAPKKKQRKNKETEKEGVWGFKLKIETSSVALLPYLHDKYSAEYDRLVEESDKMVASDSSSAFTFLYELKRQDPYDLFENYLTVVYKLFDSDGFLLANSTMNIVHPKADNLYNRPTITSFLESEKDGFIDILHSGKISLEDIERVSKREITIDFNSN